MSQDRIKQSKIDWPPLIELTQPRNFNTFVSDKSIKLEAPLEEHIRWIYQNIYAIPYPPLSEKDKPGKPRILHGIQHVTRAALYAPIFVNLYRRYHDEEAQTLTSEDIHLIQIALLFHDSGRLNDGVDKWEFESAALLYHYLIMLGVKHEKADFVAKAVKNKDCQKKKNIYSNVIKDCDCLDVMRIRQDFDATLLDFYQIIAKNNAQACEEMIQFKTEAYSCIEIQGDTRTRRLYYPDNYLTKKKFESKDAYTAIQETMIKKERNTEKTPIDSIDPREHYKIIPTFFHLLDRPEDIKINLKKECKLDSLNEQTLNYYLHQGKIIFRGMGNPTGTRKKDGKKLAQIELEKMQRKLGIPTPTLKANRLQKDGHPFRSVSLIGGGAITFSDVGFLIANFETNNIHNVYHENIKSGFFKKEAYRNSQGEALTLAEKESKLKILWKKIQLGKHSIGLYESNSAQHNEIIYHIKSGMFSAICYTLDPTFSNLCLQKNPYPFHPYAPALKAIFLQNEYQAITNKTLDIYEYSGVHNYLVKREFKEEKHIVHMWKMMCLDYIKNKLTNNRDFVVKDQSLENIKISSMCDNKKSDFVKSILPADSHYKKELREIIDVQIQKDANDLLLHREKEIERFFLEEKESINFFDINVFSKLYSYPDLIKHSRVKSQLELFLKKSCKVMEKDLTSLMLDEFIGESTATFPSFDLFAEKNPLGSQLAKLHHLAILLNDDKLILISKQKIIAFLNDIIEAEIINKIVFVDCGDIEMTLKIAANFGIEQGVRENIKNIISSVFEKAITSKEIENCFELINTLIKFHLFDSSLAMIVKKSFLEKKELQVSHFLKLANVANKISPNIFDIEEQKICFFIILIA